MADVIAFRRREEDEPHMRGKAMCTACGHEWEAVAPVGTLHLDCPSCDRVRGEFKHFIEPTEDQPVWKCNCGCYTFYLKPEGAMCRQCGLISNDWAN